MLDLWKPLCDKYDATLGQLAIAWTCAIRDRVSLLCGARTVEQTLSNIKGGEIDLSNEDFNFMSETASLAIKKSGYN